MTTYYAGAIEYNRFMEAFKTAYPELYKKYRANICFPPGGSIRVSILNTPGMRGAAKAILTQIINEYYRPLEN